MEQEVQVQKFIAYKAPDRSSFINCEHFPNVRKTKKFNKIVQDFLVIDNVVRMISTNTAKIGGSIMRSLTKGSQQQRMCKFMILMGVCPSFLTQRNGFMAIPV